MLKRLALTKAPGDGTSEVDMPEFSREVMIETVKEFRDVGMLSMWTMKDG